eukprot:scaffold647893_cov40-Prasinocladus_malaysianus.AAC.2
MSFFAGDCLGCLLVPQANEKATHYDICRRSTQEWLRGQPQEADLAAVLKHKAILDAAKQQ